jgi:hypothetical protein
LTARTTGLSGRPVLSQRFVRAVKPSETPDSLKQRTFVLLGSTDAARAFFKSRGLRTSDRLDELLPDTHVVVIWNATHLSDDEKRSAKALCDFAGRGGRVVVLSSPFWSWPELCDVTIGHEARFSRVFPCDDVNHPLLSGIDPQWLIRWNGLPGTVAIGRIQGAALDRAKKILWAREAKTTIAAELPVCAGDGRILFVQLDLQRRLDRSISNYDPVAERVLLNLLGGTMQRP